MKKKARTFQESIHFLHLDPGETFANFSSKCASWSRAKPRQKSLINLDCRLPFHFGCVVLGDWRAQWQRCPRQAIRKYALNMEITIEETPVIRKTKELCQTILDQPAMKSIRQRIESFMGNEQARAQYDDLVTKGQALQQKQQLSMQLSGEEIADFEQHRDKVLENPVARAFLDAQEELHEIKHSIHQYVNKTLELGRMPSEEDLSEGCGHGGCGCGHEH